ncbi:Putative peptidase, partial [hydrothermal vent metagenome]
PSVSSYNNSMELAGEFVFRIRANAGTDLDAVQKALDTALQNFERDGVNPQDLQRIKAQSQTRLYASLATVLGKSRSLASDNEFTGDPAHSLVTAKALAAVTAADVMAVYAKYIQGKPAIITSFVPKAKAELAVTGSTLASVWIEEVKTDVASEEVSQGAEAAYEKTPSTYDRSEPPFGQLPLLKMPDIWQANLANDILLLGIENSETPLVNFNISIAGGGWMDPLEKKGVASLLARLMNEGTQSKTAAELERAIGLLGSRIQVSSGSEDININVTSLSGNFEATMALVEEILTSPRWQLADFERVKSAALTSITGREASPNAIASLGFAKLLYGDQHPFGLPQSGTSQTVSGILLADLQSYYQVMLASQPRFHIAGDISPTRAKAAFAKIAKTFKTSTTIQPDFAIPAQTNAGKVFFIDVPGSKQSVLYLGKLTLDYSNADANKLVFTNEKLGGGISGDLAQTLRIEKGYTYGAYSRISGGKITRPFSASTSVRANATKASLQIIRDMLTNYGPDFSAADVQTTRQKLIKENTRAFESLNAKLGVLQNISKYGKTKKYVEEEQSELVAMPLDEYQRIAKTYLDEAQMVYLIVGDKATQFAPVNEFAGGKLIELDIHANPKTP